MESAAAAADFAHLPPHAPRRTYLVCSDHSVPVAISEDDVISRDTARVYALVHGCDMKRYLLSSNENRGKSGNYLFLFFFICAFFYFETYQKKRTKQIFSNLFMFTVDLVMESWLTKPVFRM